MRILDSSVSCSLRSASSAPVVPVAPPPTVPSAAMLVTPLALNHALPRLFVRAPP